MVEASFHRRDSFRRGGFTLIEVVIALAIFVIGAIAIIRIFPPALGVIQNSGDRLTAINRNRSQITFYANRPEVLPDTVYDEQAQLPGYQLTWRDGLVGSTAGTPRRNNSLPIGANSDVETAYKLSALDHAKVIQGERHVIPTSGIVLTHFRYAGAPNFYREDTVSGVTVDGATANLDFSKATKDSDNSAYIAPTINDAVYVSYKYLSGGRIWSVEDEPIRLVGDPVPMTPVYPVSHPTPVDGSVQVKIRQKAALAMGNLSDNNYGLIDFNNATDATDTTIKIPVGASISIDYKVEDWRWLVTDATPSVNPEEQNPTGGTLSSNLKTVRLPIRPLDTSLATPYLYSYLPSTVPSDSLRDSNRTIKDGNVAGSLYAVSPKTSQIIFDVSKAAVKPALPQTRVVYRAIDNWANQLSVAARSYLISSTGPSKEPWRDCAFNSQNKANNYLYFKPNEAGKTVRISYSYLDGNGIVRDVEGRLITLNNSLAEVNSGMTFPSNFAIGGRVAGLELTGINGETLTPPNPPMMLGTPVVSIREIKGVSIQSRTAWQDGSNFTQVSSVGFREVNN